ncbi:UNVERIFIED_CONTAM: Alpha-ketoglutarate-dependent dioxygenase AlkB [Sesamum angustifolium]|uniref:Alpha-ketoglutarate-dependent dioxygenase AlkB n=1 Tax=Sesamum angustifolium TaxID=2727405 RepID=A0AAW2N2D7_9LAMI
MQLGVYRTTLTAARLSSVFRGKMMNRGLQSRTDGNSVNSKNKLTDHERGPPQVWNTSKAGYEEEFPSLSDSVSNMPKSKRRTRIDLGIIVNRSWRRWSISLVNRKLKRQLLLGTRMIHACSPASGRSPYHLILEIQGFAKLIMNMERGREGHHSLRDDTCLPTSFGKKPLPSYSRNPRLRQTYHEHGEGKRRSPFSGTAIDEPFDICISENEESSPLTSAVSEKNKLKWVPKVRLAEEIERHENNIEKNNNIENSVGQIGQVLRPGMVLFKSYIPLSEQVKIVNRCRELGCGPGGFYRPGYDDGAKLRLYMMCLGLDWNPQTRKYGERRHHDQVAPPGIPHEFTSLVRRALDDSHTLIRRVFETENVEDVLPAISPDLCIVNFYTTNGRLGLHQDRDESPDSLLKGFPVVSISIGDSAEFLYGDQRDVDKAKSVLLKSGDVLIFGGESRLIFHGVKAIIPDTAPRALLEATKLRPGRLNLTFRKY